MWIPASRGPLRSALALLALLGATGCRVAEAKVWNLEQVHDPEGRTRRRGALRSDWTFLLSQFARSTHFGGSTLEQDLAEEKTIEDPLGECLENVLELGRCSLDERTAGLQAATFAWLAVDCEYVLSRERCALQLGELGARIELEAELEPPPGQVPASAEEVKQAFDELVAAVRGALAAPGLDRGALAAACGRAEALALDRRGALRLLRAASALLEGREGDSDLERLHELRLELMRRCITLALREALLDGQGRVRAAALEAGVRVFPEARAALLRRALTEPLPEVEDRLEYGLRALELLIEHGLPPAPPGSDPEAERQEWLALLMRLLESSSDGQGAVLTCRALQRVTGRPAELRPEVWSAWWRERSLAAEPHAP